MSQSTAAERHHLPSGEKAASSPATERIAPGGGPWTTRAAILFWTAMPRLGVRDHECGTGGIFITEELWTIEPRMNTNSVRKTRADKIPAPLYDSVHANHLPQDLRSLDAPDQFRLGRPRPVPGQPPDGGRSFQSPRRSPPGAEPGRIFLPRFFQRRQPQERPRLGTGAEPG